MPIRIPRTTLPQEPGLPGRQARPLPEAARPIGNAPAAAADGAQQMAGLAADIFQQERDQQVVRSLSELDVAAREQLAEVTNTYGQLKGKNAVEQREAALRQVEKIRKGIRENISDRTVADLWSQQDTALGAAAIENLQGHFRRENQRYHVDTQAARRDLLVKDLGRVAFGEGYDPATGSLSREAERTRSAFRDSIGTLGQLQGWSDERVELEQRQADTEALAPVTRVLLAEDRLDEVEAILKRHPERVDDAVAQRVRAESARRRDDKQAFDAARWAEQQPGNLVEQIERLNAYVESGDMSIEVRDLAERRMRSAEGLRWQTQMREGNAALSEMEQLAQLNQIVSYDDLPIEMRKELEESGRETAARNWFGQGKQFVTTTEGLEFLIWATDSENLTSVTRDQLEAARPFLTPAALAGVLSRFDALKAQGQRAAEKAAETARKAARLPDELIDDEVLRRMQNLGMFDVTERLSEEDRNRYNRIVSFVRRISHNRPDLSPSNIIDEAIADTLTVGGRTLPVSAWTESGKKGVEGEQDQGSYDAGDGYEVSFRQVPVDFIRKKLAENERENARRRRANQSQPVNRQMPMLPVDRPTIIREMATQRRGDEARVEEARSWLDRATRGFLFNGVKQSREDAWHKLPSQYMESIRRMGIEDVMRTQWLNPPRVYERQRVSPYGGATRFGSGR